MESYSRIPPPEFGPGEWHRTSLIMRTSRLCRLFLLSNGKHHRLLLDIDTLAEVSLNALHNFRSDLDRGSSTHVLEDGMEPGNMVWSVRSRTWLTQRVTLSQT
jgi:hypothetical protein